MWPSLPSGRDPLLPLLSARLNFVTPYLVLFFIHTQIRLQRLILLIKHLAYARYYHLLQIFLPSPKNLHKNSLPSWWVLQRQY